MCKFLCLVANHRVRRLFFYLIIFGLLLSFEVRLTAQSTPNFSTALTATEDLTVLAYQASSDLPMTVVNTTTLTYARGNNQPIATSARYKARTIYDGLSGRTLETDYGETLTDKALSSYDALGRPIRVSRQEMDANNSTKHTTATTLHYVLSTGENYVTTTVLENNSKNPFYTKTQYYTPLGKKQRLTDSVHGDNVLLGEWQYNDLGQLSTVIDSHGNHEIRDYDAQNRLLSDRKIIQMHSATHRITTYQQYHDVKNKVTRWTVGQLKNLNGYNGSTETTAKQTQQLDDNGNVIRETLQTGISGQANEDNTRLITNHTVNNFGKVTQQTYVSQESESANIQIASTPLVTHSTYDADNTLASTTLFARSTEPMDKQVTTTFQYDLNRNMTSKMVNNVRHYHYYYDANHAMLAEYRCTTDDCSQTIHQGYNYYNKSNEFNAYEVKMTDWTGTRQTTTHYESVNGKRQIASQQTPDYQISYTYNYAFGKVVSVKKVPNAGGMGSEITYTYRPDGKLLTTRTYQLQAGKRRLLGHPIIRTYCGVQQGKTTVDNLCRKVDAAGVTHIYQYDGERRVDTRLQIGKHWLASSHDTFGALGELQKTQRYNYPSQQKAHRVDSTIYRYDDAFHHLTDIAFANFGFYGGNVVNHLHYNYQDKQHHYTRHIMEKVETTSSTDSQITTDYHYANSGQLLQSIKNMRNNQTTDIATETYQYNQYNPTEITLSKKKTGQFGIEQQPDEISDYHYDSLDRLQYIRQPKQSDELIHYDNNGEGGNVIQDEQGNHYTYNNENKEVSYADKNREMTTQYTYNANGLRDSKTQNSKTQNKTTQFLYLYDGNQLSTTIETQGKPTEQGDKVAYLDGDSRSAPVQARVVLNTANQLQQVQFLQHDKRGSTINYLAIDNEGKTVDSDVYHYNNNGVAVDDENTSTTHLSIFYNPIQFGHYHDQETGQQGTDYKLARSVHVFGKLTRFITMDYGVKLMNLYQLGNGNINENMDRNGHKAGWGIILSSLATPLNFGIWCSPFLSQAKSSCAIHYLSFAGWTLGAIGITLGILNAAHLANDMQQGQATEAAVLSCFCAVLSVLSTCEAIYSIRRDYQLAADFRMDPIPNNAQAYDFKGRNLMNIDFSFRDDLAGVDFSQSSIAGANFEGSDLTGARFCNVNGRGANFRGANLTGANFSGSALMEANFRSATLTRTNFAGVCLVDPDRNCCERFLMGRSWGYPYFSNRADLQAILDSVYQPRLNRLNRLYELRGELEMLNQQDEEQG